MNGRTKIIPAIAMGLLLLAAVSSRAAITLTDFKLSGELGAERAVFTLNAIANVEDSMGGALELLSGTLALTEVGPHPKWVLRAEQGRYTAVFERGGKYPIQIKFATAVRQNGNWNSVDFRVAPAAVLPVTLKGLAEDTQFEFAGAAKPERKGGEFTSFLPSDGSVKLAWKEARKAGEGKLFFAAEMLSQVSVSPGLMRQVALLDFKVMQGELSRVTLLLNGAGEVTRVQGEQVLSWNLEPSNGANERRLVIQLNQPQKDSFGVSVQLQTPLGAFPQTTEVVRMQPEGATRFAGHLRVVNEGAVRLEVLQSSGLSQISPEQFPESEVTKAALRSGGSQRFAFRFSGAEHSLRVQADQIQPEIAVSKVLTYHHGQSELSIEAELELDVREAPLRELLLRVPRGYAVARINASGMSDYFLTDGQSSEGELRIVYGQPVSGRQVVQLRLERNKPPVETTWTLPRVDVARAKSVRGNVGISADAGFRLTPERTQGLTEIGTAFFPRKTANLQSAFRLSEPNWEAAMRVERLPQTVQADVFHLFSIGEGVAYGSSVINYMISGAPVSALRVELSDEYFNVEFTVRDVRNWQRTTNGFIVQLHSPVSGAYTLLATYERPFKPQGETLAFTGARPADAQSESGHTLVISAYQFQVKPEEVTPGLLALETGEVPSEYRLFFDAPILAAYRYTARPFNLRLALSPLEQGRSLAQVVDRAALATRISKEGQVLTDVTYFLKNRGNPNFRLTLPPGVELWSATVNDSSVVPVKDKDANLIPLPQRADANSILKLELKLAAKSSGAVAVNVSAPIVDAPVMLAEWRLEPDAGQRLAFVKGDLTPANGIADVSGFAQLSRMFFSDSPRSVLWQIGGCLALLFIALVFWRWATGEDSVRFGGRHILGGLLGVVAVCAAVVMLSGLLKLASQSRSFPGGDVTFLAPVQQAGSALTVTVANDSAKAAQIGVAQVWPALVAVLLWMVGWRMSAGTGRNIALLLGWTLCAWTALRCPNGAGAFLIVLMAFAGVHSLLPALRRLWSVPARNVADTGSSPAVAALVAMALLPVAAFNSEATSVAIPLVQATNAIPIMREPLPKPSAVPESVTQQVRIEENFAFVTARIRWQAQKGDVLPLLIEPAVLTRFSNARDAFRLTQATVNGRRAQQLVAQRSGAFDIELEYQVQIVKRGADSGFALPTACGLINKVELTVAGLDVDAFSAQAVSVEREFAGSNTVARLVLSPVADAWIGWKPRSRDLRREKSVFYAEVSQLYVPSAGVIEGVHHVSIRPAQGELGELVLDVPRGTTVTDVTDSGQVQPANRSAQSSVSLWRFDPDARKLRITFTRPQSRAFTLVVRSQVAAGTLPFEQPVGLVAVDGAAGEVGTFGVATGNEVQLDNVAANGLSPINLEDFPSYVATPLASQFAGLTVRRAFRYSDAKATATVKASPVEPDVRVDTQDSLSLGEDRTVLASSLTVDITRAGIFRLSFVMPQGFDVESISGAALSHWTELKSDAGRVITLNLRGKTEGRQQFHISLAGPGVKTARRWSVPQITLREAGKLQGTLLVVPEQGMQLQTATVDGLSQLDPQRSGVKQKGVLAFRILQSPWKLALDIEQVDAWIQVTSLQHATVNEAQVKVAANLQYQIENTGLKALRVWLPMDAENVRFAGQSFADADFQRVNGATTNGLQLWEVKLQRRVIGTYLLQVNYQTQVGAAEGETMLRGVQAADVNLQRGFVTLQTGGRVQVSVGATTALQPTEWQSIPRVLQQNLQAASANFAFRLADPAFQLPLKLDRHEAVRLLPARVHNVALSSVISDAGVMLTQVRLEISPGDKRLLHVKLPKGANYWFAFVNQNGVWPWRDGDAVLIPLEQQSRNGQPVPVEIFYSSEAGKKGARQLDLELLAPKFDLPLENISWRVFLNEKWHVKDWAGTLQLQEEQVSPLARVDVKGYLEGEATWNRAKTREAEQMLEYGNNALQNGDPQQARRAFQSAFGLSTHDNAFNEDARVQLHNLKLQQAQVGLNVRQVANSGTVDQLGARFKDMRGAKELNYSQQEANELFARNSADDNAATLKLAEKLIQQQDAAVTAAGAIRANIPEQGRVLTFQRSVAVDKEADLRIGLKTTSTGAGSFGARAQVMAATVALLGLLGWFGRKRVTTA